MSIVRTTILILLVAATALATDPVLHLGRFSTGNLSGWKEQTVSMFKSKTTYAITKDNDRSVMVARSHKSASGQIFKLNTDPKEYQILKWSWKIEHTIKKGNEKTREGDDFAVRVYVIFPRGFFSSTRAICYVWANKLSKGEHVISPFTPSIITVAADSGPELAGRWTFHQHNILDDYRKFFNEDPPLIGGVAIMTDTDNTGESAVGYYGDISLVRVSKTHEDRKKEHKPKERLDRENPAKEQKLKESPTKEPIPTDQIPSDIPPAMNQTHNGGQPFQGSPPAVPNPPPVKPPIQYAPADNGG